MATNLSKYNTSSMQVMKTLQILLENNYTMQELVEKLNEKEKDSIFNNSVISKYINTCRYCGIEIPKIQNKYFVAKLPFGLNLSANDINLLRRMQILCKDTFSKKINEGFEAFIAKLNKFSNKTIVKIKKDNFDMSFEAFEKAIHEEKKILLRLKTGNTIECIPIGITTYQKRTFFNVRHNNKEKSISVDRIIGLEITTEHFSFPNYESNNVVFEVKGNLVQRYNLRANEELIKQDTESAIITNKGEDMDLLLSRLLRYDSLCEVKSPANYRAEMIKIINETLANYGE